MIQNLFAECQSYLFLVIGLFVIGLSVFLDSNKSKLKQTGIPVNGIIYEQNDTDGLNQAFNNSSFVKSKIIVRFVTQELEWITGTINQDFQLFYTGQYKNGDTVKIYYDKTKPSNFYVDTKQSKSVARIVVGIVGFIFFSIGLYKLLA